MPTRTRTHPTPYRPPFGGHPALLQALQRLQDQLRSAYGDRWTLILRTPDFAVVDGAPEVETALRAAGSGEETKTRAPRTGETRLRPHRGGR